MKVVPHRCITDSELRPFQYTTIDEFSRLRFLAAYPKQSTYSFTDFLKRLVSGTPEGNPCGVCSGEQWL